MRVRDYTGPLGILAAGAIGLSLLCSVSAMAMGDLNRIVPIRPLDIVNLAVSNLETAAAFTEQVVTVFVPTSTMQPAGTPTLALLSSATNTPRRFVTITPTFTRRARITPSIVVIASRTQIIRTPTNTLVPTRTKTLVPTRTRTPIPPTTPVYPDPPTRTNTPVPPTIYP